MCVQRELRTEDQKPIMMQKKYYRANYCNPYLFYQVNI